MHLINAIKIKSYAMMEKRSMYLNSNQLIYQYGNDFKSFISVAFSAFGNVRHLLYSNNYVVPIKIFENLWKFRVLDGFLEMQFQKPLLFVVCTAHITTGKILIPNQASRRIKCAILLTICTQARAHLGVHQIWVDWKLDSNKASSTLAPYRPCVLLLHWLPFQMILV